MKKKKKKGGGHPIDLTALAERGLLPEIVEQYVLECIRRTHKEERKKSILPNVAGFCRFCGVGREDLEGLRDRFPREYGALLSVFEDEALNSDLSSSALAYYMKNMLGDDEVKDSGIPVIRFEHDILSDGQ